MFKVCLFQITVKSAQSGHALHERVESGPAGEVITAVHKRSVKRVGLLLLAVVVSQELRPRHPHVT